MVDLWKLLKGYHYHRDFEDVPQERRDAVFNALLGYCELDTLAMVMLVEAWRGCLSDWKCEKQFFSRSEKKKARM